MLKGVATRFRRIIDDVQPYQRGRRAYRDPLAVLSTISNRDKHNDVYVCVAAAETFTVKLIRPLLAPPDRELTIRFGEKFVPYAMTDGQEFLPSTGPPAPLTRQRPWSTTSRSNPLA